MMSVSKLAVRGLNAGIISVSHADFKKSKVTSLRTINKSEFPGIKGAVDESVDTGISWVFRE